MSEELTQIDMAKAMDIVESLGFKVISNAEYEELTKSSKNFFPDLLRKLPSNLINLTPFKIMIDCFHALAIACGVYLGYIIAGWFFNAPANYFDGNKISSVFLYLLIYGIIIFLHQGAKDGWFIE